MMKEQYSIRLLDISTNFIDELIKEMSNHQIETDVFKKTNGSYNIIIKITNEVEKNDNIFIILKQFDIKNDNVNLFISFTTNNEISGFTVSKHVFELLKKYFNSIDISIIFLGE